jgi:myo-inositol-1(or 4)-monophosphatase
MTISGDIPVHDIAELAREAGKLALTHFQRLVSVESKGHLDLVTAADRAVELFLTERLRLLFPEDGIFGEEGAAVQGTSDRIWVLDPIDGTFNFVRGGDQWMVSIGLYEAGRPRFGVIHAPVRGQTITGGQGIEPKLNEVPIAAAPRFDRTRAAASVGFHTSIPIPERLEIMRFILDEARMTIRCCGSATISLMEVALGHVDGYVGVGESTWDVMAALPILAELGLHSTLDWTDIDLSAKLKFTVGTKEFNQTMDPAINSVARTTA